MNVPGPYNMSLFLSISSVLTSLRFLCKVCGENEYVYLPPGGSDIDATCQPCPTNSSSTAGNFAVCECFDGTGRISEALGMLNATEPCSSKLECSFVMSTTDAMNPVGVM